MSEFVRKFHNPLLITLAQFVVTGFICTVLGFLYEPISFAGLVAALPDLLLLGVFSTGLGYILQAIAQSKTSLSAATIILSLEAVFGAVAGVLLLDEVVSPLKLFGALLILAGVMVVQFASETKSGSAKVTAAIASHTKSSLFQ